MRKTSHAGMMAVGFATLIVWFWNSPAQAQAKNQADLSPRVVLTSLSRPVYPPVAVIAHISGEVTVKVSVHPDGSIESVEPGSGNPTLMLSAIGSAQQSKFECRNCGDSTQSKFFTYFYQLVQEPKPDPCCCSAGSNFAPIQQVSQLEDRITITQSPVCICPDECTMAWAATQSKFRSIKCLYLWKCGRRKVIVY